MSKSAQVFVSTGADGSAGVARSLELALGCRDGSAFSLDHHRVFVVDNPYIEELPAFDVEVGIDRVGPKEAQIDTARRIFAALKATNKYVLRLAYDVDEVIDESYRHYR